jgi:HEPN domain-containing protein/predicted nucleotidyltransferase
MKKSLSHLPDRKRWELSKIRDLILEIFPEGVEMIILFGSHARGDWVEDIRKEDHITYEYKSDYDILVVTVNHVYKFQHKGFDDKVRHKARKFSKTEVSIIIHGIGEVNEALEEGQYFFSDIKKEGVMLYDSGRVKLARRKPLDLERRKAIAERDFNKWFTKARDFVKFYLPEKSLNISAFNLHQAVEHAYSALLLVFTGYKPKDHDLDALRKRGKRFCPEIDAALPRQTEEQKRLYNLLKKAYVDARYKDDYKITADELKYLAERVQAFHKVAEKACQAKLENF